ncbi:MAG: calcium/proton exchanger [Candidatus Limnocylindrales bacterium]
MTSQMVPLSSDPRRSFGAILGGRALILLALALIAGVISLLLELTHGNPTFTFVASAVALAGLAGLVGEGTEQLGHRFGPGLTGVLQSALGNLPELFIGIFSLRAGLVLVVQSALIGSILANSLLVLGLAFVVGGLRHGVQSFGVRPVRMVATLLVLAVAALAIPTLATMPGAPDAGHATDLSVIVAIVLLILFAASIPFSIAGGPGASSLGTELALGEVWPLRLAVAVLLVAAVASAFVSDWFVDSLRPALASLGISEAFAGLVIVAIAGNAVENVAGVQAALRNKADLAVSLVLNSSLQVALALIPALVLISVVIGGPALTLVASPLLVGAVSLSVFLCALVVFDGQSTWLEGLALIALYVIIAASVWFGPPIQAQ